MQPISPSTVPNAVRHVSFSPLGGAGAVAVRLMETQRRMGWQAELVHKVDRPFPAWARQAPLLALKALADHYLVRRDKHAAFFSLLRAAHGTNRFARAAASAPDILHLHWLPGMIRLSDLLRRPLRARKVVWSVQDLWLLTGGCHYANGCEQFTAGCRGCPQVKPYLRRWVAQRFRAKAALMHRLLEVQLVAPSAWTRDQIRRSLVTRNLPVSVIPNPVDTKAFAPGDRQAFKRRLNLNPNQTVIGLGAAHVGDERKQIGATLAIIQALPALQHRKLQIIVFGTGAPQPPHPAGLRYLGAASDPRTLRTWYGAMDVFLSMSLYETFGNTLAEAAACGTPSICLGGSGMSDVVVHGQTGLHVNGLDELPDALAMFNAPETASAMGERARRHACAVFDERVVARQFLQLYMAPQS